MNVIEAIEKRRSIRDYRPDPVPDDVLGRLLNAMRLAPSGSNRQPWKFIVVRDKETKTRLAEACAFYRPSGELRVQRWIAEAPVIIVACGAERLAGARYFRDGRLFVTDGSTAEQEVKAGATPGRSSLLVDLAIAIDHLSLAAMDEGLGTCWVAGLDERLVGEALSLPDGWRAPIAMTVGYPAGPWPEPRPRKPLADVVCYEKFS
ncbi:MAG: nitroreductase family protein [Bacteroidetes bacterium]|nr:nitroreductase family protein [Bacteroidota bacterium]MCL5027148.1 nitroreductase family protein [Chloroflexota bacterium]